MLMLTHSIFFGLSVPLVWYRACLGFFVSETIIKVVLFFMGLIGFLVYIFCWICGCWYWDSLKLGAWIRVFRLSVW